MPYTQEFRLHVEEVLASVTEIKTRALFGGIGIYSEGLIFALIDDDRLYFKVDKTNVEKFQSMGMEAFIPFPGSKPMGYYELPASVFENEEVLKEWITSSMAVARRAKKK